MRALLPPSFTVRRRAIERRKKKVRGERLTGGPRVKNMLRGGGITRVGGGCGLGWPGGTASASFFSFPFL